MSAPASPSRVSLLMLPMIRLFSTLPVPLLAAPAKVRFSRLAPKTVLMWATTVSVPPPTASMATSPTWLIT
ncbi:MAG: hypothetical protein C4K60_05695 [Ideonella sp. MAG2]|nr:MAG: hypothetical protein C4K60_05695 [Ideonella sp. MAG2]